MSFLQNPKLYGLVRIGQLAFALAFLIVLAWCNQHKGAWINLEGTVALGVITTIFTFIVDGHAIWSTFRKDPFGARGKIYTYIRIAVDFIIFLMWCGTVALMLRPKEKDLTIWPDPGQPEVPWAIGDAFAFVEIVSFILTMVLIFVQQRHGVGDGGTSATYV